MWRLLLLDTTCPPGVRRETLLEAEGFAVAS
jgi:hypothetical protein